MNVKLISGYLYTSSVAEEVESLCNVARERSVVSWILVIPLLHLLKGDSKPFESVPPTMDPPFATWAGLKGIKIKDPYRDTRYESVKCQLRLVPKLEFKWNLKLQQFFDKLHFKLVSENHFLLTVEYLIGHV